MIFFFYQIIQKALEENTESKQKELIRYIEIFFKLKLHLIYWDVHLSFFFFHLISLLLALNIKAKLRNMLLRKVSCILACVCKAVCMND